MKQLFFHLINVYHYRHLVIPASFLPPAIRYFTCSVDGWPSPNRVNRRKRTPRLSYSVNSNSKGHVIIQAAGRGKLKLSLKRIDRSPFIYHLKMFMAANLPPVSSSLLASWTWHLISEFSLSACSPLSPNPGPLNPDPQLEHFQLSESRTHCALTHMLSASPLIST